MTGRATVAAHFTDEAMRAIEEAAERDGVEFDEALCALVLDGQQARIEAAAMTAIRSVVDRPGWRTVPMGDGQMMWMHVHAEGSADTLMVFGGVRARGERTTPSEAVVWRVEGSVPDVAAGLLALPHPLASGAPSTPLGGSAEAMRWE